MTFEGYQTIFVFSTTQYFNNLNYSMLLIITTITLHCSGISLIDITCQPLPERSFNLFSLLVISIALLMVFRA
ncbi:hypothetical protein BC943DRAFT_327920 [Umbelopsis sp. AD052]|nr:hypothetical protein BC943DRAFT_327920 [Umbelopsis sp. AD052]